MKSYKLIIPAMVAATFFAAGAVSAQTITTGGVNLTVTPTSGSITPGSGVTLGTLQFSGGGTGGASIASVPVTFGATGGGSVSNLSNCRFFDAGGSAISGSINPAAGSNNIGFNSAFGVSQGAGTSTLSIRCDVATSTPAGTAFQVQAASVNFAVPTSGGTVNVAVTPATGALTTGTGVTLGTIALSSGSTAGASVGSLPITLGVSGSGSVGNLSNCRLFDVSGNAVSASINPVLGPNSFNFNSALGISQGTGTTALTLRCDVAANTPSGTAFQVQSASQIQPGAFGSATLAPFAVNLDVAPSVPRGSADVALANISLAAGTSSNVRITSIPLSIIAGGTASLAHLSDCRIRDTSNVGGSLSGTVNLAASGATVFNLSSPLTVLAGGAEMLSLSCDVSTAAPIGGTFSISIVPSQVTATNSVTGAAIFGTPVTGFGPNGLPASTSGTVVVTGTVVGTPNPTPGVPNTGLGDSGTMTLGVLLLSALFALGGTLYLRRTR